MSDGLSYFVDNEINTLCFDDNFAHLSQEIFSRISEDVSNLENESFDIYEDENQIINSPEKESAVIKENLTQNDNLPIGGFSNAPQLFLSLNELPITSPSNPLPNQVNGDQTKKYQNDNLRMKIKESDENQESNPTTKGSRLIIPEEFLSLKRKDVIMKSIFRMMRRYYCKLLEDVTGYNRKEK